MCVVTLQKTSMTKKKGHENPATFKFGLSILHARIRLFESLLHLAYKIPLQKWQARSADEKQSVKDTKAKIQKAFKSELGLLVEFPRQGFGSTNDGNTSRRFFENPDVSSRITGVNLDLTKRLKLVLEFFSSGHTIDTEKFSEYALETAKLYVALYAWHPMTPTMHKILVHGSSIIKHALLPLKRSTRRSSPDSDA
jgi:hypothetical protein